MNVAHPSPEQLHQIFFDPPEPPELPAKRLLRTIPKNVGRKYRRRKFKLESQGQADRRVRRSYRAAMVWFYAPSPILPELEMKIASTTGPSFYDFVMGQQ